MTRIQWSTSAAFVVLAIPCFAQKSVCDLVTPADAAAILGAKADKQAEAAACIYKLKGSTASVIVRSRKVPAAAVKARKENLVKAGVAVKDEPGLGTGAYSIVRPYTTRIHIFKNDQMLRIEYTDSAKTKTPDAVMDKMRAAAKAALGRI